MSLILRLYELLLRRALPIRLLWIFNLHSIDLHVLLKWLLLRLFTAVNYHLLRLLHLILKGMLILLLLPSIHLLLHHLILHNVLLRWLLGLNGILHHLIILRCNYHLGLYLWKLFFWFLHLHDWLLNRLTSIVKWFIKFHWLKLVWWPFWR